MISVLVVDDSVVIRRMVTDVLNSDPGVQVVGTASNGQVALAKVAQLKPDLVTLDVEMPVLDGVSTVRELRRTHPRLPVIMFSTLTSVGADATLAALAAGASDYVTKPANVGSIQQSITSIRQQLLPRIHALCERHRRVQQPAQPVPQVRLARTPTNASPVDVVAIGSSTGGPEALRTVIEKLPGDIPVPILVVQHMPAVFTTMLAKRLDMSGGLHVVEAENGTALKAGTVYVAPGDRHLEVTRSAGDVRTKLTDGPPENHCRPAVDVLFRSVAKEYGGRALAVVLTGMGQDGKLGCRQLRSAGARIAAQDEESSVVWGMPGAVATDGLADAVLPLQQIAQHILSQLATRRAAQVPEVAR